MKIRWKMVFIALPLIVAPLLLTGDFAAAAEAFHGVLRILP
jgi:hypothetical protein